MIEQDYVDVESETESENKMDCTPSNSTQSKVASREAPVHCTTTQNNDLVISTVQQSDAELSKAFKEIIDLLEKVKRHHFPDRSAGPSFNDLRSGIVKFYDLAKDADNVSRANLHLLAERLQSAQLLRKETITGLAVKDDVRVLRDDLSKLMKTMTTDNNSVPPSLKNDFKALREAVIESLWATSKDSRNLKKHISSLKGQCSLDDDENHATLDLLADELDTFRYELAMLRRDITSVRVPGVREDISISKDVDALYMSVNTLERKYGKNTNGSYDLIAPTLTDIPTLRNQIRILRGAASSIHDILLRNEKNMHQRVPELNRNLALKCHIRATQVLLKKIRDRINYGPSPPLHHAFLEHDAGMAQKEDVALRKEIAWLCNDENPENDAYTSWLLGPFTDQDSLKEKILDLCGKDCAFKDKLAACLPKETPSRAAAIQDEVESAKNKDNGSSVDSGTSKPQQTTADIRPFMPEHAAADSEASGPEHTAVDTEASKPEQDTADGEVLEAEQSNLQRYLLEFERKFSGY